MQQQHSSALDKQLISIKLWEYRSERKITFDRTECLFIIYCFIMSIRSELRARERGEVIEAVAQCGV